MLVPLGTEATDDDRKSFLENQLDSLRGQEVLGSLLFMEGAGSRARGGVNFTVKFVATPRLQSPLNCLGWHCFSLFRAKNCHFVRRLFNGVVSQGL